MRRRVRRSFREADEDDDELEVTSDPIRLRGSVHLDQGEDRGSGALFGVPWWLWVLGAAGTVTLIAWWFTSNSEPDPEIDSVPPDSSGTPNVNLADVGGGFKLESSAARAYLNMKAAAQSEGVDLPISTAWRSLEYQTRLYNAWVAYQSGNGPPAPLAAKPGANAPHQRGIALDLNGVDSRKSNFVAARRAWLDANAEAFGWKNTGATFSFAEPWHYEYVGAPGVA